MTLSHRVRSFFCAASITFPESVINTAQKKAKKNTNQHEREETLGRAAGS